MPAPPNPTLTRADRPRIVTGVDTGPHGTTMVTCSVPPSGGPITIIGETTYTDATRQDAQTADALANTAAALVSKRIAQVEAQLEEDPRGLGLDLCEWCRCNPCDPHCPLRNVPTERAIKADVMVDLNAGTRVQTWDLDISGRSALDVEEVQAQLPPAPAGGDTQPELGRYPGYTPGDALAAYMDGASYATDTEER
jgi:hypothetical protein